MIKLQGDLEDEMRKTGWSGTKLSPQEAYDHISKIMKRNKNKAKNNTELATVFNKALIKAGVADLHRVWSNRYYVI